MSATLRPARQEDVGRIAAWTRDTFSWGDYIGEDLPEWIDDPSAQVLVAVDEDDVPVGVSRAEMLSPNEGWLSAARVHPDHRRRGIGTTLNDAGVEWARNRGAQIVRLTVDDDNQVARAQVEKLGYRNTCVWLVGEVEVGGHLVRERDRLHPAISADADAGWQLWSASDLARAGRELWAGNWRYRKAHRSDLDEALANHTMFQGPAGWVVAQPDGDTLQVKWLATDPPDGPALIQGILEVGRQTSSELVQLYIPDTAWSSEALIREGFSIQRLLIYAKSL
jgi:GNAT superfamily N-acetyltransferase